MSCYFYLIHGLLANWWWVSLSLSLPRIGWAFQYSAKSYSLKYYVVAELLKFWFIHFFFLSNTARAIRAHAHAHTPWPGHRTDEYDSILFFCYFFMNHGNILNEWMNCENKYFNKESSLWKVYSVYMCSCRFSVASSANCWCVLNSCACGDEKRRIKRKTP